MIKEGNVYEVNNLYENSFPELTDQYFKTSPWPEAEDIAPSHLPESLQGTLLQTHLCSCPGRPDCPSEVRLITEGKLRDRHDLFTPHRFESYYNYCKLFNYILSAEQPVNLELPNQWLWEIIDEFIYQFQAFSQFRSKHGKKTDEEIEILKSSPKVIEN